MLGGSARICTILHSQRFISPRVESGSAGPLQQIARSRMRQRTSGSDVSGGEAETNGAVEGGPNTSVHTSHKEPLHMEIARKEALLKELEALLDGPRKKVSSSELEARIERLKRDVRELRKEGAWSGVLAMVLVLVAAMLLVPLGVFDHLPSL
eukprot:TRINITY_DN16206_c0_g1_i1.p1 TRINITY_DN16206_c0_g1~~TRINITY_DN16206_c0_g1_i1.p1  ORF type:complete len:153 (+),score=30.28 TRINITY_DN16206_c0_g1_i1:224-682(+)